MKKIKENNRGRTMNQKQIFMGIIMIATLLLFSACAKKIGDTSAATQTTMTEGQTESSQQNTATQEQTTTQQSKTATGEQTGTSAATKATMMSSSDIQSSTESKTTSATASAETSNAAETTSGVDEFTVKAFRFGYQPDTLTVKKGDLVKITIDNVDGMHGINLFAFGVQDMDYIEFKADKAGTFMWYCSNFCGQGHSSMRGTLIVEE